MPRVAERLECAKEQIECLNKVANSKKSEKRLVDRARMVLGCAQGRRIKDIAKDLGVLPNTVIKWREKFKAYGIDGLYDEPRLGRPEVYGKKDILAKVGELLKEEPPYGYSRRNGTTNLFAALAIVTGSVKGKTTKHKKREDFLSCMDEVVEMEKGSLFEGKELQVILDNYCTHKRCTEWLDTHSNVHFHLSKLAEQGKDMVQQNEQEGPALCEKIREFIDHYDEHPKPFVWRKREVRGAEIRDTIVNLIN